MFVYLEDMKLSNVRNKVSGGHDATLEGQVDLDNELVDLKCTMIYSEKVSKEIIKLIGSKMYEVKKGRVHIPVTVKGSLERPIIKVAK